jgi:hypothetical protein
VAQVLRAPGIQRSSLLAVQVVEEGEVEMRQAWR